MTASGLPMDADLPNSDNLHFRVRGTFIDISPNDPPPRKRSSSAPPRKSSMDCDSDGSDDVPDEYINEWIGRAMRLSVDTETPPAAADTEGESCDGNSQAAESAQEGEEGTKDAAPEKRAPPNSHEALRNLLSKQRARVEAQSAAASAAVAAAAGEARRAMPYFGANQAPQQEAFQTWPLLPVDGCADTPYQPVPHDFNERRISDPYDGWNSYSHLPVDPNGASLLDGRAMPPAEVAQAWPLLPVDGPSVGGGSVPCFSAGPGANRRAEQTSNDVVERHTDPYDGQTYTFREIRKWWNRYGHFDVEIKKYWETECKVYDIASAPKACNVPGVGPGRCLCAQAVRIGWCVCGIPGAKGQSTDDQSTSTTASPTDGLAQERFPEPFAHLGINYADRPKEPPPSVTAKTKVEDCGPYTRLNLSRSGPGKDANTRWLEENILSKHNDDEPPATDEITTLMICDIPCRQTVEQIIQAINDHGFANTFNLVYMPSKRPKYSQNMGYAFVNFKTTEYATQFGKAFQNFSFPSCSSKKLSYTKPARHQGYTENVDRYVKQRAVGCLVTFDDNVNGGEAQTIFQK